MATVTEIGPRLGIAPTCAALGLPRATYYRRRRPARPCPRGGASPRALGATERAAVLAVLHAPRFEDPAPAEVYATLLDEGTYLCSERTMYRLLAADGEMRERRDQLAHPAYAAPELLATPAQPGLELGHHQAARARRSGPTSTCTSSSTSSAATWSAGWSPTARAPTLAERLIAETFAKQDIRPRAADPPCRPRLLDDLQAGRVPARRPRRHQDPLAGPHVSNDNPFSEAQFKTLKYRPAFPDRFGSIEDARAFCQDFFRWYNAEHRHVGIGLMGLDKVFRLKRTSGPNRSSGTTWTDR